MSSLLRELKSGLLKCPLTQEDYLPHEIIRDRITLNRVKESLPKTWGRWLIPCWDCDLENNIEQVKKTIAILILIGKLKNIDSLLADGLTDEDLPVFVEGDCVMSRSRKKTFRSFQRYRDEALAFMFEEKQKVVLTPKIEFKIDDTIDIKLTPLCALPFTCKKKASTEFSTVYCAVPRSSYQPGLENDECEKEARYAVKKFSKRGDFDKERENLDKIKCIKNENLVKHLVVFEEASCIFFPWADGGNLWEFWENQDVTKLGPNADVIRWSLQQMDGLAHAVEDLHQDRGLGHVRHGDLKPPNILHFKDRNTKLGVLKVADFGVSRLRPPGAMTDLNPPGTITKASTLTYQGPEAHKHYSKKVRWSRRYDSWSMGCIMLEFVVWLMYGFPALASFASIRGESYYQQRKGTDTRKEDIRDTMEVQENVIEAINHLIADSRRREVRDNDNDLTALGEVVSLVYNHLLKIWYEDRLESADLRGKLQEILDKAEKDPPYLADMADRLEPLPLFCMMVQEPGPIKYTSQRTRK